MSTVREFIRDAYSLINPSNPTQPLHGNDLERGIRILNQHLRSYAGTGLLLTIAKTVSCTVEIGQEEVVVGPSTYTPTPDITEGRLANLNEAWLLLEGVAYPLIPESREDFLSSFRYDPLQGLPRFIMEFAETEVVKLRLYPSPSQAYELFIRGKFQLNTLTSSDTMDLLPQYVERYLLFAVSKDIAMYKGRSEAWTATLEDMLRQARDEVIATSEVSLEITGDRASMLNGWARVKAGV